MDKVLGYLGIILCWKVIAVCVYAEYRLITVWSRDKLARDRKYPRVITGGVLIRKGGSK